MTARFRWRVDQTWTKHAPLAGVTARRVVTLPGKRDPRQLPPTSEPTRGATLGARRAGADGRRLHRLLPCYEEVGLTHFEIPLRFGDDQKIVLTDGQIFSQLVARPVRTTAGAWRRRYQLW
jgi:hypothetical protein